MSRTVCKGLFNQLSNYYIMKKRASIKSVAILSLFTILLIAVNSTSAFADLDTGSRVTLKEPVSLQTISEIVKKNGVEVTELYYQQGEIQGGYTLDEGVDIDTAIADFEKQHAEFIEMFTVETQQIIDATPTSDKSRLRHIEMLDQFKFAQSETINNGLQINSFDTQSSLGIDSLDAMGYTEKVDKIESISDKVSAVVNKTINGLARFNPIYTAMAAEAWAPNRGTSNVTKTFTKQTFSFPSVSSFGSRDTYEHETQVYNSNFADYNNFWSSNMPNAYKDTQFLDTLDNFTVGSSKASSLMINKEYFTHMSLTSGSATSATIRVKGQKGKRTPSSCYSTWCIFATATTGSLATHTAPSGLSWVYR